MSKIVYGITSAWTQWMLPFLVQVVTFLTWETSDINLACDGTLGG